MSVYIDRDQLEDFAMNCVGGEVSMRQIHDFPAADVVERKTGEWIHTGGKISRDKTVDRRILTCSICGNMLSMEGVNAGRGDANFCPNCGADMRGGEP